MAISDVNLNHIYLSLKGLKDGAAGKKAKELADHYGVTVQTIFRWAAKKGLRWRKQKATKGESKVDDHTLKLAGTMLLVSRRASNEITLPACDAMEMLQDSGIDPGVSTSWFLAKMREKQISARDILRPSPHSTLLSEHPNHVWQFDVTNCIQYFLDDKKGMGERDQDMELYKNKIVKTAKTIKRELLRYVVVDHCTGAFYFRYFYSSGERAVDGAQFLFEAMRPKDELIERIWSEDLESKKGKYRFHGVPFILVADKGSITTARANQNLLDCLRCKLETHMAGNPRAKGAVEWLNKNLIRFEGRLKFERPVDLEDLNRKALDWCIMYCATKTFRNVAPRSALWSKITGDQIRLCPDEKLYKLLIRQPTLQPKANGACIIRVDGKTYKIPDTNAAHKQVNVSRNAYEYPAVDVHFNGFVWLLQPLETDAYGRITTGSVPYGEYKSPKQTQTQKAKTEMEKIASEWGITWKGKGDKRIAVAAPAGFVSPLTVFNHQADKAGNMQFMDKKGTELEIKAPEDIPNQPLTHSATEVSRGIVSRSIPLVDFMMMLKDEIGVIPKELNQRLKETFTHGVSIDAAPGIIDEIKNGYFARGGDSDVANLHTAGV